MSKVRAAYNYSYNYEGMRISFKKDEEFQLLTKSNKDWWQVRRWKDGLAQDIYVPAVYVKEVNETTSSSSEPDPTYMNLGDLKKYPESIENGAMASGTVGNKSGADPSVVPSKRKNSLKKQTLERKQNLLSDKLNSFDDSETSSVKENGPSTSQPVSSEILLRLSNKKATPSASGSLQSSQGKLGSLKRDEHLNLPPPVSTKPRSKTHGDTAPVDSTSLDTGTRNVSQQPATGQGSNLKVKVPPPVQSKPQKGQVRRPVSCMGAANAEREVMGHTPTDVSERPVVSELSNILLRKNPHLVAGEHKVLAKTMSSGSVEQPRRKKSAGSATSPTEPVKNQLQLNGTTSPQGATPPASIPPPALPAGWTEHKTSLGQTYYYDTASGQSSWTRPQREGGITENKYLEKVAPRGWTKEINPITSTPIYTNSRTGERWGLASDGRGNYYYYNMANSSLTVGELPEIVDIQETEPQESLYDSLAPKVKGPTTPTTSPSHTPKRSSSMPNTLITEAIASSLSNVLNRHGFLHRKRLYDSHSKKAKDKNWLKYYVMLQCYELIFYPDIKSKDLGSKPTSVFCLLQSTVSPYNKDKKKANVFQVSSHLGEQFLLQAETPNLMNEWYSTIQTVIDQANHDYKDNPDKFKTLLLEPLPEDDGSPKLGSLQRREKKLGKTGTGPRNQSLSEEMMMEDEEDPMDDMEATAAGRSYQIRGRLRRLMAKRPEKDQLKSRGILEDPVFGCELSSLCERQGTLVPKFFIQFMHHIEKVGLDVVGIYRLSGNAASVNKLRYLVEQDEPIDLDSQEWSDINIVTGCLKLYLRELPDPIIPFKLYKPFIEAARASTQPQRIQQIANRVKDLPNANYHTLKALIQHLRKVVEKGSINKMFATNVAIVFGPTVMRAETDSIEMATLMPIQNGIVEIMVNEYDSIFRK